MAGFAALLTGIWILLNFAGDKPLDDMWNIVFGVAIGLLGLISVWD